MQIVLDFVEGKISVNEFMAAWDANPAIGEWVDQLVDLRSALKAEWSVLPFQNTEWQFINISGDRCVLSGGTASSLLVSIPIHRISGLALEVHFMQLPLLWW